MFTPSMWVGLAGIGCTLILLAADWYIWDPRYRISQRYAPRGAGQAVADDKDLIHVPSASGRELVATLAAQSPNCSVAEKTHAIRMF
jgi:hypothetical protein